MYLYHACAIDLGYSWHWFFWRDRFASSPEPVRWTMSSRGDYPAPTLKCSCASILDWVTGHLFEVAWSPSRNHESRRLLSTCQCWTWTEMRDPITMTVDWRFLGSINGASKPSKSLSVMSGMEYTHLIPADRGLQPKILLQNLCACWETHR